MDLKYREMMGEEKRAWTEKIKETYAELAEDVVVGFGRIGVLS